MSGATTTQPWPLVTTQAGPPRPLSHRPFLRAATFAAAARGQASLVYSFETRRPTDGPDAPPRTVGWTALVPGRATGGSAAEAEAVRLCLAGPPADAPGEAARDKVVLCDLAGHTLVYQADRDNRAASLCACGNASAASAAMLAHLLGGAPLAQSLALPDGEVGLKARPRWTAGAWRVSQRWKGARFHVEPARLAGREVAVCTGTLNDYLLVRLGGADELASFTLDETKALWRAAGSFGFQDPLRCRLAAVAPDAGAVRFFTCGRMHPGAPLTGLAVLALAAREVGWLAPLREAGRVSHRRGADALPQVVPSAEGLDLQFPTVDVALRRA